ncbi:hypothetical protein SPSYN_00472 [Sporotomaculum syntrophicum]|uniref:DUF6449 domain-containing protein n=1 Tax=Sporotomaculum syntrophicum TaxID=182264 RepID=A0A9D2WSW1_9FIRM|nr:hypothetical protein SPSYN_00472 [Sporotomaculum syntrophicum]
MTRDYQIIYDEYANFLKPIYESEEYKKMHYDILQVNPDDVEKITLRPNMSTGKHKELVILEPTDVEEAGVDQINASWEKSVICWKTG